MNGLHVGVLFLMCVIFLSLFKSKDHFDSQIIFMLYLVIFTVFDRIFTVWGIMTLFGLFYLTMLRGTTKKEKIMIHKLSYHYIFFLFWFVYAVIQMLLIDYYTETSIRHFQALVFGIIIIYFMSIIINSKKSLENLYFVWGFGIFLTLIIGWWELVTGNHLVVLWDHFLDRVTVNYFNPNNYSFLLSVSIPIIIYWVQKKYMFYKLIGLFMFFSSLYFVYINGSRLSILVLLLFLFIYLSKILIKKKELFIFFIILLVLFITSNLARNIYELLETLETESNSTSIGSRNYLYKETWKTFLQHPFGVGPGKVDSYMYDLNPHNFWLEVLANYGIFIFVGLTLFYIIIIYRLFKIINSKGVEASNSFHPILWSILIFIPTSFAPSSIMTFGITWFILGLMVSVGNVAKREILIKHDKVL